MRRAAAAVLLGWTAVACARSDPTPTWSGGVAALVHRHCLDCHVEGGSAPFALDTWERARKRASLMAAAATAGAMPPWKPVGARGVFEDERGLSPDEVALLAAWAAAGAPEGDPAGAPAPPPPPGTGWRLGEPDAVLALAEPYLVPPEGGDVFRAFGLTTGFAEDRFVRAFEVRFDNPRAVHHLILRIDETGIVRGLEAAGGDPGVASMPLATDLFFGEIMGAWLPGVDASALPADTAMRVPAGADLVFDMHFQTTGKPESVRAEVGLYFAEAPERLASTLFFTGGALNIPPGEAEHPVRGEFRLPADVRLVAVAPHAHYVCRRMQVHARAPGEAPSTLIRIDDWDFAWQGVWRLREPLPITAGTVLALDYVFDNSAGNPRNPHSPPRRMFSGPRSTQEMATLWMIVSVSSEEERVRLRDAVEQAYAPTIDPHGETSLWLAVLDGFDADRDGSLDAAEDAAAREWLAALRDDEAALLEWFDRDASGALDPGERAEVERLLGVWRGER